MPFLITVDAIYNGRCLSLKQSMPLRMVDAINLGPNRVKIAWLVYSICLMGNHALFYKELWDWLLKMAGEDDPLGNLMKSAIEEVNNRYKSVESSEIEEETFRDTLPEGYTYNIEKV